MLITCFIPRYIIYTYKTTNILYKLKKMYFFFYLPPKPSFCHNTLQSSVFHEVPMVNALIKRLSDRMKKGDNPKESEFSKIMFAIIPYYFKYNNNYTFSPEVWNDNSFNRIGRCDGMLTLTDINQNSPHYGYSLRMVMYECKRKNAISWWKLLDDQLWEQADSSKNKDGKLWVIAQIGFELCVFKFDILNYLDGEEYRNFCPLNINNWSKQDLEYNDIRYIEKKVNNVDTIVVIKWRLDVPEHHLFIHEMLNYISRNNP